MYGSVSANFLGRNTFEPISPLNLKPLVLHTELPSPKGGRRQTMSLLDDPTLFRQALGKFIHSSPRLPAASVPSFDDLKSLAIKRSPVETSHPAPLSALIQVKENHAYPLEIWAHARPSTYLQVNKCPPRATSSFTSQGRHCRSIASPVSAVSQVNPLQPKRNPGPLACLICGRGFSGQGQLNRHMRRVHMGVRPFSCPACDKTFYAHSDRDRHFRDIHTKERPFKCDKCPKAFKNKQHRKGHVGSAHQKLQKRESRKRRIRASAPTPSRKE